MLQEEVVIARDFIGQELEGDETIQAGVFGSVDHTHATTAELLKNAVVRNGLAEHGQANLTCGKQASQ